MEGSQQTNGEPNQVGDSARSNQILQIDLDKYCLMKIFSQEANKAIVENYESKNDLMSNEIKDLKRKTAEISPWNLTEYETTRMSYVGGNQTRLSNIFCQNVSLEKKWDDLISNLIPEQINSLYDLKPINNFCFDLNMYTKRNALFYCALYINHNPSRQMKYGEKILNTFAGVRDVRNRDQIFDKVVAHECDISILKSFVKDILYHPRMRQYTENRVEEFFPDSDTTEDCKWIERRGIALSCLLDILTPKMAASFIKILYGVKSTYKTFYVEGVINDLILGYLFKMKRGELPFVDKLSFVRILMRFLEYHMSDMERNQEGVFPLSNEQLETSLKFVNADLDKQSYEFFFESVEYLIVLGKAGFKILDGGEGILVVDPVSDFNFEIPSRSLKELFKKRRENGNSPRDLFLDTHRASFESENSNTIKMEL